MLESISTNQLKQLNNINIIDIRSVEKYNSGYIMNAINIPFNDLVSKANKYLNKDLKYYIYCQKGVQSKNICKILKTKGYNVININGGYESWIINS